ncbi:MAG: glycosyltransferase [Actinomycetales bacterium]|nr:glycosyltransferase [Actinomycetales bacterium]
MAEQPIPESAHALVAAREAARAARDFTSADALREQLRDAGFLVTDTPDGPVLAPAPPYRVDDRAVGDGSALGVGARVSVAVLVNSWVADADECVRALLALERADVHIVLVDVGDRDGSGSWAQSLADAQPERVSVVHLPQSADHWARIHSDLIGRCSSDYYCVIDPSTVVTGDAVSRLCDAVAIQHDVIAAGWRGADVDTADAWRSVTGADGEVDVVLSYLMVVRTDAARAASPDPKARFYRNADIEWCLALRQWHLQQTGQPARLVALGDSLPARQGRHHGYHDSDPDYRDRESRKTYDRILQRFRGRSEILKPR